MGKKQKRRLDWLGCDAITVEVFFCAFECMVWSKFVGGGQSIRRNVLRLGFAFRIRHKYSKCFGGVGKIEIRRSYSGWLIFCLCGVCV